MKKLLFTLMACGFAVSLLLAQDSKDQLLLVHHDYVLPSMSAQYEETAKEFVGILKKHNLKDMDYVAVSTEDFDYYYVSPIENMADLDKNPMAQLSELEDKETMAKIWESYDECYDRHGNFVIQLDNDLSYMPENVTLHGNDQLFRRYMWWKISAGDENDLADVGAKIKALHVAKNSESHYRVYRNSFGSQESFFLIVSSATSPMAFYERSMNNNKLLGAEFEQLIQEGLKLVREVEYQNGWIRPDLGYTAKSE